ncbi:lytic transglycosylase domain-containing protein [Sphingomonas sp. CFBP 13720]|uniref:lytic transglycosylase domain-containing protein n=1 Tax=Sphingomonas sp. CFBP 13720 TaxID=2775302 RepID=UPI00177CDCD9|nr:lytic transglycosylase domain-containing protein [Sphingomonas sp. CFBP 13720]MBD8677838.1 lytic transglycosylase domain-containing protein [Sphingomonas sp. CFBP 13720]
MSVVPVETRSSVHSAIARASARTGVDFNYLLGQAQVESGLRSNARAATSSASGLYQFVEQSWLGVVKAHGGEHGMAWAADSIRQGSNGRYHVADGATRQAILNLRNDPQAASLMAAEHAADNKASLEGSLGREATGTDLYMAHFLGLGGARQFLSAMDASPDRSGAAMFPAAARANRGIFFGEGGQPRSLSQIYDRFAAKLDRGAQAVGGAPMPTMQPAVQRFGFDGDVVVGSEAQGGDEAWLATTLANLNVVRGPSAPTAMASLYRPTPESARLAYSILARLGTA